MKLKPVFECVAVIINGKSLVLAQRELKPKRPSRPNIMQQVKGENYDHSK